MTDDELNALAAEKVMGWVSAAGRRQWWFDGTSPMGPFNPLHSIADAMRLLDKFEGWTVTQVPWLIQAEVVVRGDMELEIYKAEDKDPARAVTLACLKAVGAIE